MNTRSFSLGLATLLALAIGTTAGAAGQIKLAALPFTYDPGDFGNVGARWFSHEGFIQDDAGDHGLVLYKDTLTGELSAAGAFITGVEGLTIDSTPDSFDFGFDIRADSHIGAGAPRFNVETDSGLYFVGGAANGVFSSPVLDGKGRTWYRVRFDAQNPGHVFPRFAAPTIPAGAKVLSITLVVDEGNNVPVSNAGFYVVDNVMFHPEETSTPILVGKPGQHGPVVLP